MTNERFEKMAQRAFKLGFFLDRLKDRIVYVLRKPTGGCPFSSISPHQIEGFLDEQESWSLAPTDTSPGELVAALRTCEATITNLLEGPDVYVVGKTKELINLRAARHLARRALGPSPDMPAESSPDSGSPDRAARGGPA